MQEDQATVRRRRRHRHRSRKSVLPHPQHVRDLAFRASATMVAPMALSRLISPLLRAMRGPRSAGIALAAALALFAPEAKALSPYLEIPDPAEAMKTPAYRYANMSDDEAFAELNKRGILYSREKAVPGVRAPIRLTGRLHGILIRSVLPPAERATTPFEILDARLALSLDDFTSILAAHDVDEVVHYTMYRPNVPKPTEAKASAAAAGSIIKRTS